MRVALKKGYTLEGIGARVDRKAGACEKSSHFGRYRSASASEGGCIRKHFIFQFRHEQRRSQNIPWREAEQIKISRNFKIPTCQIKVSGRRLAEEV